MSIGLMGLTLFAQLIAWVACVYDSMEVSMKLQRRAALWRVSIMVAIPVSAMGIAFIVIPMIYALIAILIDSLR
jgi:hypothetical protein